MFDIVPGVFAFVTLVIVIFICEASGRQRGPKAPHVVAVAQQPEAASGEPSNEDKETQHWTAQGLHKLGYSMPEARRMAALVPPGYGLQDALQWCLRNKGAKQ